MTTHRPAPRHVGVGPRLHGLDTLRAFAVLAVMLYHLTIFGELPQRLLPVTYHGWMGVDLFFVLSGFLIGQQLLKPYAEGKVPSIRSSVQAFYLRRAYRILPVYLVVVALYFLVPAWREAPTIGPLWKFLTFTMNFGFSFRRRAFSHAWSLCVEEHFYLVLPVLVALLMRKPSARKTACTITFVVLGGLALRYWLIARYSDEIYTKVYYTSYSRLDGLTAGVTLALLKTFRPATWDSLMQRGHTLFFAGIACVAPVIWMFRNLDLGSDEGSAKWGMIVGLPLLSLGLGLITASAMSRNGLIARYRIPGAQTIAALAFALYLTHKEVGHFLMEHVPTITKPHGPASWLLYATTIFATAWLLHIAIERPFLRLRDRHQPHHNTAALEADMRRDPAL
ncbi:Peptidoglycan/LPS O-acetylase OafA/YrhL, contains acyltransferase and SGNH-hydrolase domains [Bryocella elongata]|uniref:Peptidoglycan/LPS O-acetylase OafA/YrhL, contains acyltransferase and SGNH-hydrolase domains n=1 Tax=Bryocella elongata TaxID=863522 RepID=A0A1H5WU42_9BACT|nr:acyltransferase [Bryocella elongata]SEG02760.1 Peptidoglycan/LPS O-acetylase OafA/YrhL, contains acyltransferase and SGNH-hydrolase domains [Bryocella elongata]